MFRTLQAKLLASYALIVFLCVFLVGASLTLLLQDYQERLVVMRLEGTAATLARRLPALFDRPVTLREVSTHLQGVAARLSQRLALVTPDGTVVADTGSELVGEVAPLRSGSQSLRVYHHERPSGESYYLVPLPVGLPASEDPPAVVGFVALVVPGRDLPDGWGELMPRLLWAALISLAVSIGVAAFLARSITNP